MSEEYQEDKFRNNHFVDELVKSSQGSERKFVKFVNNELFPRESKKDITYIYANVESLNMLEEKQLLILKSIAESLEKNTDVSKVLPTLLTIMGIVFAMYNLFITVSDNSELSILVNIVVMGVLSLTALGVHWRSTTRHKTATYFKKLINSIEIEDSE